MEGYSGVTKAAYQQPHIHDNLELSPLSAANVSLHLKLTGNWDASILLPFQQQPLPSTTTRFSHVPGVAMDSLEAQVASAALIGIPYQQEWERFKPIIIRHLYIEGKWKLSDIISAIREWWGFHAV